MLLVWYGGGGGGARGWVGDSRWWCCIRRWTLSSCTCWCRLILRWGRFRRRGYTRYEVRAEGFAYRIDEVVSADTGDELFLQLAVPTRMSVACRTRHTARSETYSMSTSVGVISIGQNAARKPCSFDPACMRSRTAFCSRRLDTCPGQKIERGRRIFSFRGIPIHFAAIPSPTSRSRCCHLDTVVSFSMLQIRLARKGLPHTKHTTTFCSCIARAIPLCRSPAWNIVGNE